MRFNLMLLSVLLLSTVVYADEKNECGLAIDEADKIVPDPNNNCDHTKTGLNGVLHRAFASKNSVKNSNLEENKNSQQLIEPNNQRGGSAKAIQEQDVKLIKAAEFSTPQELQSLKFSLLKSASLDCPKGFVLDAERYIPSNKNLTLELEYKCL